jgi:uncharacterized membrane protein YoaK (UPF0700 family)
MLNKIPKWIFYGASLLALNAGYVNSVALLGFAHNAVSHITGTMTAAGNAFSEKEWQLFFRFATIIFAFFFGAVLSGIIIRSESLKMGRRYGFALLLESLLLFTATFLFIHTLFLGELVASVACGLQNAMVATYSGSIIRTTHLTGIVSDLGAAVGAFLSLKPLNPLQIKLHLMILGGFFSGSVLGALAFKKYSYLSLFIPSTLILLLAIIYSLLLKKQA